MAHYRRKQGLTHTHFSAVSDKTRVEPEAGTVHPTAEVMYEHGRNIENFYPTDGGLGERVRQPTELFEHRPGKITTAFSDPSMKAHVPTVLGMVADYHQRMTGSHGLPMPDSDLSQHSSRMVQHLQAKGMNLPVNKENPKNTMSNDIDWAPMYRHANNLSGDMIPPEEVQAGKRLMRGMLRKPGSQFNQPQGEQLRLF